eukprot:14491884-Alexandrium_andersonii.AAC.1
MCSRAEITRYGVGTKTATPPWRPACGPGRASEKQIATPGNSPRQPAAAIASQCVSWIATTCPEERSRAMRARLDPALGVSRATSHRRFQEASLREPPTGRARSAS